MDVIRRIHLLDVIGTVVTDDPRSKVTTGDCLAVMLCAVFSGAHDLYGVRERLSRFDMATIMQDRDFSIDAFPEERLAKAMDDIWKAGPEKLGSSLLRVGRQGGLIVKLGPDQVDHIDEVVAVAIPASAALGGLEEAVEALHEG